MYLGVIPTVTVCNPTLTAASFARLAAADLIAHKKAAAAQQQQGSSKRK